MCKSRQIRRFLPLLIATPWLLATGVLQAQAPAAQAPASETPADEEAIAVAKPVIIVNVAAVDRVLERINDVFTDIDRSDVTEQMQQGLKAARDLQGLDRTQPLGLAVFLPDTLPPRPTVVGFVPVGNIDELLKTLDLGPLKARKKEGAAEGHFELVGRRRTMQLVVQNGYAFVTQEESLLDTDLESLAAQARLMAEKYNLAITVRPQNIPLLLRDVFLGFLRTQTEAQLQRRDDEPESQYLARRANGVSQLEFLDRMLRQSELLTIGVATATDGDGAVVDVNVEATPDSEFAEYLAAIASRPSAYTALFNSEQPFTFSASWTMEEREKTGALDWIKALEAAFDERLAIRNGAPAEPAAEPNADATPARPRHPALERLIGPLEATIENAHFDMAVQIRPIEANKFVLVGALGLVGGETFAAGLRETLDALQGDPDIAIELDVDEHEGIVFHKLVGPEMPERERRTYGSGAGVYLGASARTLWFAVGGEEALSELKSSVNLIRGTGDGVPQETGPSVPFQLVIRGHQWTRLPDPEDEEEAIRSELAREALTPANDTLRFDIRPTEGGLRMHAEVGAGFLRMIALGIARGYDESRL